MYTSFALELAEYLLNLIENKVGNNVYGHAYVRLKEVQFSLKNAQELEFSGSPSEFGNPGEYFWLGNELPHQEENFMPSCTPVP